MPPTFGWDNFEDIAIDWPTNIRTPIHSPSASPDMHKWITELPGFSGDPAASNESKLEAIQMAWTRIPGPPGLDPATNSPELFTDCAIFQSGKAPPRLSDRAPRICLIFL